jgi:hypothetical protein
MGDLEAFQNDWIEIDVDTTSFTSKSSPNLSSEEIPEFLDRTMDRFREREEMLQVDFSGTDVMIFKSIFAEKFWRKLHMAFFAQTTESFCKSLIITLFFLRNAPFFRRKL